jgi:hypothetical protein
VALVGAEYEENLSLRYLASALERAGFSAAVVPFNRAEDLPTVVEAVLHVDPLVVGISVPFQLRAVELLDLGTRLRERGYAGHICIGGHFATFEYENVLRDFPAIDSVVRHEGEEPFLKVCELVRQGVRVTAQPGVVVRTSNGIDCGEAHRLPRLDDLPFPDRRGRPHDILGVPCSPIVASRGCYADCSFCCIYAYSENARAPRYRRRSPESIVAEMKQEYERRGVRLFVFHDDNFFLLTATVNLKRYDCITGLLHQEGMDDIALVIKCRPNDVTRELFELLKSIGLIRAYVGIETNSEEGIISLNRRITPDDNRRALQIIRELDIYCSFNVLIFDPEATLEGVECNLDFMDDHADVPFNFCRAEVYAGTPLKSILEAQGRLEGSYLAWNYEMRDPRVELLFRIAVTAFQGRNFKSDGVHNLNMGVRFDNEVMRRFYPSAWDERWHDRLVALSREIGRDSVQRMRGALAFVQQVDLSDRLGVKRFALTMSCELARADLAFIARIKALRREMEQRIRCQGATAARRHFGHGMPTWAAETARLVSSTGREIAAEPLPNPSRQTRWS